MSVIRATPYTLADAITRVREEVGDPATYPADGASIPVASRRFSDDAIVKRINDQLIEMQNYMTGVDPGDALLQSSNFSYSGDSQALPAEVTVEAVYKLEDITDTNAPFDIPYVSARDFHLYSQSIGFSTAGIRYTLLGSTTGATYNIAIRPSSLATRNFRIWYVAAPTIFSPEVGATTSDVSPLSSRWRELIVLGASLKLMRRDAEATDQQQAAYQALNAQFVSFSSRQRGPAYVTRKRKGF